MSGGMLETWVVNDKALQAAQALHPPGGLNLVTPQVEIAGGPAALSPAAAQ